MPDVEYARSGDVAIAHQVVGDGPVDLVFSPFVGNSRFGEHELAGAPGLRDLFAAFAGRGRESG